MQRINLELILLMNRIEDYWESKGDDCTGHDKIKRDFFQKIYYTYYGASGLKVENVHHELSRINRNNKSNDLFYKQIGSNENSQAAQLVRELFMVLGEPLTDEQLRDIVEGKTPETKLSNYPQDKNPFADDNPITNPFDPRIINQITNPFDPRIMDQDTYPQDKNPFANINQTTNTEPKTSYNPFDALTDKSEENKKKSSFLSLKGVCEYLGLFSFSDKENENSVEIKKSHQPKL